MFFSKFKKYRYEFVAIAISLWAFYLRILTIMNKPQTLMGDEQWQVNFIAAQSSFLQMIRNLPGHEHCSYLSGDYILIYPFFKMCGYNRWCLSFPHIVITAIGFYFLYLIGKQYFKTIWGFLIAFGVVCFNFNLVYHSVEIRTYAVLPTLALMTFYFSKLLFEQYESLNVKQKLGIGSFFVLVLWFHVYGVAILFCIELLFALDRFRALHESKILLKLFKFFTIVGLIAAPLWFLSVFGFHLDYIYADTFTYIPNPIVDAIGFLKSIFGNLLGRHQLHVLFAGFLAIFLPTKIRMRQIGFFLILVILPIAIHMDAAVKSHYWFLQRQFTWVMPFFAFFLGWLWDSLIHYFLFVKQKNSLVKNG